MQVSKSIAYRRADGGISICHPVISSDDPDSMTEQDAIDRALASDIPEGSTSITLVDRASIPDRNQREAWFSGLF